MTSYSRRQLFSVLYAAVFWGLTTTAFILVPVAAPVEESDYKEIRIQLAPVEEKSPVTDSTPVVEPVPEPETVPVPEPVAETLPVTEEVVAVSAAPAVSAPKAAEPAPAPAAPKKTETVSSTPKTADPAPAPAAKTPMPAPEPVKQTLVKSVDQLMAEQAASKGTKKNTEEIDWDSLFGESSTATSSVSTGEKTFVAQQGPSTSGQAAASAADTGTSAAAASGKQKDYSVSEGMTDALDFVSDAAGSAVSVGSERGSTDGIPGGTGSSDSRGSSSDDGLEWGSGPARHLINPLTPGINLSDELKALITAPPGDIRISFLVRADGTVLRDSIQIANKAILPAQISQEIERQISEWFFEAGKSDGQAVFVYSIIKE